MERALGQHGDMEKPLTNSDPHNLHRDEFIRGLVDPWVLCVDRFGPESPFAATLAGSTLVGDCRRSIQRRTSVAADPEVKPDP